MPFNNLQDKVLMHGPALDGSDKIIEREVPLIDVPAFRRAGYTEGPRPEIAEIKQKLAEIKAERKAAVKKKKP